MSDTTKNTRILVTGSRYLDPYNPNNYQLMSDTLHTAAEKLYAAGATDITVVHGGARGADTLADIVAHRLGLNTEPHPAQWHLYGKQAGPIRNKEMVNLGADIILAFPVGDSRGTKHCMRVASQAGLTVVNISNSEPIPDLTL